MLTDRTGLAVIALGGLMFVTSLAAIVALALAGQDTATLERIVSPLLGSVITVGVLGLVSHAQDQKLTRIEKQTNGILDERIERKTLDAIRKAGLTPPVDEVDPVPADELAPGVLDDDDLTRAGHG